MDELLFSVINANDHSIESKLDNVSLNDGAVFGHGNVCYGCTFALCGLGARVFIAVYDLICAMQAYMEGFLENSWTLSTNAQNLSYKLKVSESADLPTREFASRYAGNKHSNVLRGLKHLRTHKCDMVDWTEMGAVTPVKNREQCDSCWALSDHEFSRRCPVYRHM